MFVRIAYLRIVLKYFQQTIYLFVCSLFRVYSPLFVSLGVVCFIIPSKWYHNEVHGFEEELTTKDKFETQLIEGVGRLKMKTFQYLVVDGFKDLSKERIYWDCILHLISHWLSYEKLLKLCQNCMVISHWLQHPKLYWNCILNLFPHCLFENSCKILLVNHTFVCEFFDSGLLFIICEFGCCVFYNL